MKKVDWAGLQTWGAQRGLKLRLANLSFILSFLILSSNILYPFFISHITVLRGLKEGFRDEGMPPKQGHFVDNFIVYLTSGSQNFDVWWCVHKLTTCCIPFQFYGFKFGYFFQIMDKILSSFHWKTKKIQFFLVVTRSKFTKKKQPRGPVFF